MNLIYIPSSGRPHLQSTLQALPWALHARVRIVVQAAQLTAYSTMVTRFAGASGSGMRLLCLPPEINRLAETRAWIARHARECSPRAYYALDDDLHLLRRDEQMRLHKATDKDVMDMFEVLDDWLTCAGIGQVSVSPRFGNNYVHDSYRICARCSQFCGFNTRVSNKIKWGRVPLYNEHDPTLQMLRMGYATKVSYEWAYQEAIAYQGTGGCSAYRTAALEEKAAKQIYELHAPFAKYKIVEDKRYGGKKMGRTTFMWRKAWLSGLPKELQ